MPENGAVSLSVVECLQDDLNTVAALSAVDELAAAARVSAGRTRNDLAATMVWLGIARDEDFQAPRDNLENIRVTMLIEERNAARRAKNYAQADEIRAKLDAMGIQLRDWKDPETGELRTTPEVKR